MQSNLSVLKENTCGGPENSTTFVNNSRYLLHYTGQFVEPC